MTDHICPDCRHPLIFHTVFVLWCAYCREFFSFDAAQEHIYTLEGEMIEEFPY